MEKLKTPTIYGLAVALAGSILMLTLIALKLIGPKAIALETDMIGGTILFLMLYLFLLFGIYFAIKKQKDAQGGIWFKEAVVQGLLVSITTAFFSVIFTILFYEFLYPNYVTETTDALRLKMESIGVPNDKLNTKLEEKIAYFSTPTQSMFSFIGNLITGIAFTLLLSFFLKSNYKK